MKPVIGIVISMVFTLIFLFGCSSSEIKYMRYTSETYSPSYEVEVLNTKPIEKDFVELGQLSIKLSKRIEEYAVLILKEKARSIGADAIVMLGENTEGSVAIPIGQAFMIKNRRYLNALAIKYK